MRHYLHHTLASCCISDCWNYVVQNVALCKCRPGQISLLYYPRPAANDECRHIEMLSIDVDLCCCRPIYFALTRLTLFYMWVYVVGLSRRLLSGRRC